MSHPADELQGKAKLLYNSLHAHGVSVIHRGGWRVFWSNMVGGCGAFFLYFFPPVGAVLCFISAYLLCKGLVTVWRGMQYLGASTSVIVHSGIHQIASSHVAAPSLPGLQHDGYDHSEYIEIACGVDVQGSPISPLPNHSYPCDVESGGSWKITCPIGRVIVADASQVDYDAVKSGKARIETLNKLDLDGHGRLKAKLAMPRRRLVSNADAA